MRYVFNSEKGSWSLRSKIMDREINWWTDKDQASEIADSISFIYSPNLTLTLCSASWGSHISHLTSHISQLSPKAISTLDIWKYSIALILPHICTAATNPTPSSPTYTHLLCLSESSSHCGYEGGFDLVHRVGVFVCARVLWWMDRPWTNSSVCYISSIVVLIHHYCT